MNSGRSNKKRDLVDWIKRMMKRLIFKLPQTVLKESNSHLQ